MKYLLIFLILLNCTKQKQKSPESLLTTHLVLLEPVSFSKVTLLAKVRKLSGEGKYSLEFSESSRQILLQFKPISLKIYLPFFDLSQITIPIRYQSDTIDSRFSFESDWIDSANLQAEFSAKIVKAFRVPLESIYSPFGTQNYVLKKKNKEAELTPVQIFAIENDQVLVSGDLSKGDVILSSRLGEALASFHIEVFQ